MDIFESLESLNVSKECFNDIMDIAEKYITESSYARRYGRNTGMDIVNAIGARVGSSPVKLSKDEAKYFKYDPSSHTEGTKYKKETVNRDIKAQEFENKGDRKVPLGPEMSHAITTNEIKPIVKKLKETPKDSDEYKELENKFNKLRKRARFHLGRNIVSEEFFDDIMGIVEEYIHEVTMKRWKQAAINSIPHRQEDVDKKTEKYEDDEDNEDAFQDMEFAKDRLSYAEIVAKEVPKSKKPANSHWINAK